MNKKNGSLIMLLVISFILLSSQVLAATNIIDSILMPFKGVDFGRVYDSYYSLIDFIVYLVLFIGMAQVGLGKMQWADKRAGKSMMIVLGVALAFAAITFARRVGFRIGDLGSIAALLFFIFLAFLIFRGLHQVGTPFRVAGAVAFLLIYGLLIINNKLFREFTKNIYANLLLSAGFIIAIIIIAIEITRFFKGKGVEGGIKAPSPTERLPTERPPEPPPTGREDTAIQEMINDEAKDLEALDKQVRTIGYEINLLKEAYNQRDVPRMAEINKNIKYNLLNKLIDRVVKNTRYIERRKRRISNRTGRKVDEISKRYRSIATGRIHYFAKQKGRENQVAILNEVLKNLDTFESQHDANIRNDAQLIIKTDKLRENLSEFNKNRKQMIKYIDGIENDLIKAKTSGLGAVATSIYSHLSGLINTFNVISNRTAQFISQLDKIEYESQRSLAIESNEQKELKRIFENLRKTTGAYAGRLP